MATMTLELQTIKLSCKPCVVISVHCSSGICTIGRIPSSVSEEVWMSEVNLCRLSYVMGFGGSFHGQIGAAQKWASES